MINVDYEHSVTITFSNAKENNDLDTFMSILQKCNKEAKKSGFRTMFKGREKEMIKALYSHLTGHSKESEHVFAERDTVRE
jgi:uncharacterized protein (DUF2344 family)